MNYTNDKRGFTLIELLLGLAIFSVIALSAYSIFSTGIELNYRSELSNRVYRDARWTIDLISKELENAIGYDFSQSYPDKKAFVGTEEQVTFFQETEEGIAAVKYSLISANEGSIFEFLVGDRQSANQDIIVNQEIDQSTYYLIRTQGTFFDFLEDRLDDNGQKEIICQNILEGGLKFSYGQLSNAEATEVDWVDEWQFFYIPSNVRLEIKLRASLKTEKVVEVHKNILIPSGFLGVQE